MGAVSEDKNIDVSINSNMFNTSNGIKGVLLSRIFLATAASFTNLTKKTYPKDIL